MATKIVKEVYTDIGGNTTVEYSDDTTNKFNVADTVTASTNPLTGGIVKTIWNGTQAQYDALAVKDPEVLYVVAG